MTESPPLLAARATSLDDALAEALSRLAMPAGEGSEQGSTSIVFSGEGASAGEALRDALDDIRASCAAQGVLPVALQLEPAMQIDAGVRLWGTVSCLEHEGATALPEIADVRLVQEGEQWTIRVRTA